MIRRPPRSTLSSSSAASDVYKRQGINAEYGKTESAWRARATSTSAVRAWRRKGRCRRQEELAQGSRSTARDGVLRHRGSTKVGDAYLSRSEGRFAPTDFCGRQRRCTSVDGGISEPIPVACCQLQVWGTAMLW
eukprot:TRINITY_DN8516_c0_g1_i2.p2 TRINITY_DN8516_c0_g1~~TRINITY_DN8516_c0_g1_i2.p2  ORF type:complete len:134 (-),score=13.90 TRINITY_DN8516_c0_g1_i2:279-680(-)